MNEYIVIPEKKELPSGTFLLEELHRRGLQVEINIKGSADRWDSIRFCEPGPPEIECVLYYDAQELRFNVSLEENLPAAAQELQIFIVEILLRELGGEAQEIATGKKYDDQSFKEKIKKLAPPPHDSKELFWLAFSWIMVLMGAALVFHLPDSERTLVIVVESLALFSALGLTLSKFNSK
jgi:hypothetical protein